jgi:protein ImuB
MNPRTVPRTVPRMVPRMVTVWCPQWPVVAAGWGDGAAAAVLHANRVVARNAAAGAGGVRIGQRRREAQRSCPELTIVDHDPARDARAFEPVIRAVAELAPRLDVVEPGWLSLAARGPSRYFGGDRPLAVRLTELVADVIGVTGLAGATGVTVGVGVADGGAASAVAARQAATAAFRAATRSPCEPVVVPPGGSPAHLAPLPVAWLAELGEATPELVELLVRLGVVTLGDLAALPAADVLARFGPAGAHARRLAGGIDERPPGSVDPPPPRHVERVFADPLDQIDTVVFVAKHLADGLVATLGAEGRVCTRLLVEVETDHGERSERSWYRDGGLSAPAVVERVRWQLDGWVAQPGAVTSGIVLLRLTPHEVRGDTGSQPGLWGGRSQADDDAARAVTRLTGLVGADAVRVPEWQGGRLPGDRYRWVPAVTVDLDDPHRRTGPVDDPSAGPWPGAIPAPSPATVLPDPVPAVLEGPDGQPVRVSGRGVLDAPPAAITVAGTTRRIRSWAGPWPVDQRWWEPTRRRRLARFQVVTDEGDAHLLVVEHRRWWLLATYS